MERGWALAAAGKPDTSATRHACCLSRRHCPRCLAHAAGVPQKVRWARDQWREADKKLELYCMDPELYRKEYLCDFNELGRP